MKNILFTILVLFSLGLYAQNPAPFKDGIRLPNATEQDTLTRVPIMSEDGTISGFVFRADIAGGGGGADDQELTLVGNTLTLEDGGTVDLSGYLDNTDGQTITDLSLSGNTLSITLSGGNTDTVDLSTLSSSEVNDLSTSVTWANIPDANVPESAVTQHEGALTISESQISDLSHTVDTDTQLSKLDIEGMGFVDGAHTVDTNLSDAEVATAATNEGFVTGAHTVDTDEQTLSQSGNTVSLVNGGSVDISTTTAVAANTAKTTNATHTGEVTGSGALTIAANAVTAGKIASNAVTNAKIATNAVTITKITDANVTEAKLASNSVTTGKILNGTIDEADLDTSVNASLDLADSALQTEVDGSTTNEIQTLDVSQLNGTNLELSLSGDGEATKTIDLSSLDSNKTGTGNTIDMSGNTQYNFGSASSSATFTMVNIGVGGYAEILVNKSGSAPTVTGATQFPNTATFIASTDMVLCLKDFNGTRKYWFVEF